VRLPTSTGTARLGAVVRMVTQVPQGGHSGVHDEYHRSPRAAVAAIRSAARYVRLSSERGRAIATSAGSHEDPNLVSEHR
jgi:hypothetical protein